MPDPPTTRAVRILSMLPTTEELEAITGERCTCGGYPITHYPGCPLEPLESEHWAADEAVVGPDPDKRPLGQRAAETFAEAFGLPLEDVISDFDIDTTDWIDHA